MALLQNSTSHYNAGTWGIVQGQLRPLLAPRVYTLPMVRSIGKTMVQGKNYGPQITVKRISTRSVLFSQALHETSDKYWDSYIFHNCGHTERSLYNVVNQVPSVAFMCF